MNDFARRYWARLAAIGLSAIALLAANAVEATPLAPQLVNFQGRLADSGGAPVNATVSMTFRIYTALTGGTLVWTDTMSVPVVNGAYDVVLGATPGVPLSVGVFTGPTFLSVQVGTDAEMSPRVQIVSAPYAFRALLAETATNAITANSASTANTATVAGSLTGLGDTTNTGTQGSGSGGVECYLTEMRLFAGVIVPGNFLKANGQLLLISQYEAVFALMGTTYGGDGVSTFAMPDMRPLTPNNMNYGICVLGVFPPGS